MKFLWSRWWLSTLLYVLSLSERILGENTTNIGKIEYKKFVTLKRIVFGYKLFDNDYFDFNYFLAILGFSIYKVYYVSEQKTKQVNICSLFVREYITRISQVQKLQNSKLLAKIRETIEI